MPRLQTPLFWLLTRGLPPSPQRSNTPALQHSPLSQGVPPPPNLYHVSRGFSGLSSSGLVSVKKSPFRHCFPVFIPRFLPLFAKRTQLVFFPNPFIPQYFHIFQLGSFGKNTPFLERAVPTILRRSPRACLYDPCSHPDAVTIPEIPLVYFGRFGRFGSFSFVSLIHSCCVLWEPSRTRRGNVLSLPQRLEGLEAFLFDPQ